METFTVEGKVRESRGKNAARRTRLTGMVPAVLYGARKDSISIAVNAKQVAHSPLRDGPQHDLQRAA